MNEEMPSAFLYSGAYLLLVHCRPLVMIVDIFSSAFYSSRLVYGSLSALQPPPSVPVDIHVIYFLPDMLIHHEYVCVNFLNICSLLVNSSQVCVCVCDFSEYVISNMILSFLNNFIRSFDFIFFLLGGVHFKNLHENKE